MYIGGSSVVSESTSGAGGGGCVSQQRDIKEVANGIVATMLVSHYYALVHDCHAQWNEPVRKPTIWDSDQV